MPEITHTPDEAVKQLGEWQKQLRRVQRDGKAKAVALELLQKHFPGCLGELGGERLDRLFLDWLPNYNAGDAWNKSRGYTWPQVLVAIEAVISRKEAINNEPDGKSASQLKRLVAVMDENELKVSQIAASDDDIETRMRLIIRIDQRFRGKTSLEWASLLNCSDAAVRKVWKKLPDLRE